jgi:hypothetical protein
MLVGDPVDLADLLDEQPGTAVVREATDRIMAALTALVEQLRGDRAPAERFDPRSAGVAEIGNPARRRSAPSGSLSEAGPLPEAGTVPGEDPA